MLAAAGPSGGASSTVLVLGQVVRPGAVPWSKPARLVDVLRDAGGLSPLACGVVTVSRGEGRGRVVVGITVRAIRAGNDGEVRVIAGDTVTVQRCDH